MFKPVHACLFCPDTKYTFLLLNIYDYSEKLYYILQCIEQKCKSKVVPEKNCECKQICRD